MREVRHQGLPTQILEAELQAARQDRDGNLLWVGGGQHELHIGRWLFEGLEHGIEGMPGEHVHLVDHIHLEAARGGRKTGLFEELLNLSDATVRGRIDLDVIDESATVDGQAVAAGAAGLAHHARLAVEGLGQNARQRGLSHTPGASEQVGVVKAAGLERVLECAHGVVLSHHSPELPRSPLARQGHGGLI